MKRSLDQIEGACGSGDSDTEPLFPRHARSDKTKHGVDEAERSEAEQRIAVGFGVAQPLHVVVTTVDGFPFMHTHV